MFEVWLVSVDHEGLPIERLARVWLAKDYDDAVRLASSYSGKAGYAYDITRDGRYVSWVPSVA